MTVFIPWSVVAEWSFDAPRPEGVEWLSQYPDGVKFRISSKILRRRYPEKLHAENIEYALSQIPGLRLVWPDVLDLSRVEHVDVTADLRLPRDPKQYLRTFRCLPFGETWSLGRDYRDSVPVQNRSRSFNERLTLYDKYSEIRKNPVEGVDSETFKGVLRIEHRLTRGRKIRQELGITETTLRSVLNAPRNPTVELLKGWQKRFSRTTTVGKTIKSEIERRGIESLLDDFDNDLSRVELHLKAIDDRPGYWMRKVRAVAETRNRGDDLLGEIVDGLDPERNREVRFRNHEQ